LSDFYTPKALPDSAGTFSGLKMLQKFAKKHRLQFVLYQASLNQNALQERPFLRTAEIFCLDLLRQTLRHDSRKED